MGYGSQGRFSTGRSRYLQGFTLIEVLVVVAIIALLVSVLISATLRAREKSRQAVCLSNLHQHALAFSVYSAEQRHNLPMVGRFRYTLAEGEYYPLVTGDDWIKVNNGALYPRYCGNEPEIFYCPSNRDADADRPRRGKAAFLQRHQHPRAADPEYVDSHDAGNTPIGAYAYALPAATGKCPRDGGARMYPSDVMMGGEFYRYITDPTELSDAEAAAFLGHFPRGLRGKHLIHALMSDAYFGGYHGYHLNGFNVLFGDFHAKRVSDPNRVIISGTGGGSSYTSGELATAGRAFMVWDYFSRNH